MEGVCSKDKGKTDGKGNSEEKKHGTMETDMETIEQAEFISPADMRPES
jgi:hypothetical protein